MATAQSDNRKSFVFPAVKAGTASQPTITITTRDLDREHDRIFEDGIDFADFLRAGGPVLYGHDASELPVAKTARIERMAHRGLRAHFDWLTGDARADRVRNAFDQGVLNGASIGFLVRESVPNEAGGYNITRSSLIEWSLTPIPCNPMAVRTLKGLGLWSAGDERVTLPTMPSERPVSALDVTLATREAVRSALIECVQDAVQKQIRRARGDMDYLLIADEPRAEARRALARHHYGGEPTVRVPGMTDTEMRRHAAQIAKTALADAIATAVSQAIRRARGRVD